MMIGRSSPRCRTDVTASEQGLSGSFSDFQAWQIRRNLYAGIASLYLGRGGVGTGDGSDNKEFKANRLKVGGEVFWQAWHAEGCIVGLARDSNLFGNLVSISCSSCAGG